MKIEVNKLNELLKSCVGRKITRIEIGGSKLFPNDDGSMVLKNIITEGFFNVTSNDKQIICIGLKDNNGAFVRHDFAVQYQRNEAIRQLEWSNIKINFEYETN